MKISKLMGIYVKILGASLFLLVVTVSFISSLVSMSMYSIIHSIDHVLSEVVFPSTYGRDNTIVITSSSTTPFTGVFNTLFLKNLSMIEGVVVSKELLVPVVMQGRPVILRGVDEGFVLTTSIRVIDGEDIDPKCLYCLWVGEAIADLLDVKTGDHVVLASFFSKYSVTLVVKGVYKTNSIYDYEVIASINVAQVLRGSSVDSASIVRITYDPEVTSRREILEHIGIHGQVVSGEEVAPVPFYVVEKAVSVGVGGKARILILERSYVSEIYLRRIGLSTDILYVSSILIVLVVSFIMYSLGTLVVASRSSYMRKLFEQGLPVTVQKTVVAITTIPVVLLSSLAGAISSSMLMSSLSLKILFNYTVTPVWNSYLLSTSILSNIVLYVIGIFLCRGD